MLPNVSPACRHGLATWYADSASSVPRPEGCQRPEDKSTGPPTPFLPSWSEEDSHCHVLMRKLSPVGRVEGEGSVGSWDSFPPPISITKGAKGPHQAREVIFMA